MGVYVLIDDFRGDPQEFYNLVVEEINKRELTDVKYDWVQEVESTKMFFNKGDKTQALRISFRGHSMNVLGYQIGGSFHASARTSVAPTTKVTTGFLYETIMDCFEEVVKRSVRAALARHLEARSVPVPHDLNPREVFFEPTRAGAA